MNPPPVGSKRKAPMAGGAGLLDSIMGGMSRTMAKVPVQKPGQAARASEEFEVASHYGMLARPSAADLAAEAAAAAGGRGRVCRNPLCGRTEFDTDSRQGDRICRHCGCVQNTRSIESHEEEHRSFADDEKKESKKRAEQTRDGRTGGATADKNMQMAMNMAAAHVGGPDGLSEADARSLDKYTHKVGELASRMSLQGQIVHDARNLCERLVRNQADHKNRCTRESCRLNFKAQKASLIAAGVLKEALKSNGVDRLLEEFKSALMGLDLDATEVRRTGKYVSLVAEMLKGQPYACSDSAKGVEMLGGAEGGSDAAMNSAALNAVPRICEDMQLPFFMKLRSEEIIEDWARAGMPAIMPQTIAACAILRANDELIPHALRKGQSAASLPKVDVSNVALASGIAEGTILKQMKHPALPWPTTAVDDLSKSLRLGKELCVAARTKLDDWLQERDGRKRDWVRTTRPKLLAACALLVASREKARAEPGIIAPQLNVVAETIQDGDGQLAEAFGACPFASA